MQTEIKNDYDAGIPGQLAVLTSFNSAAKVRSCRVEGVIYPGDAVKPGSTTNSVVPWDAATDAPEDVTGVAVRAHTNMPMRPTLGYGAGNNYPVDTNSPVGACEDGPIYVAVKAGEAPVYGDLAEPLARNATTNVMEWGVLAAGQTRAKFVTGVLPGNVAIIQIVDGALLGKSEAPVIVPVTGVEVTPATASLALSGTTTQQLTATVSPVDASDPSGAWSSDDESIATVDADGLVTAVAAGTANITFTTTDGAKTDACAVTVEA